MLTSMNAPSMISQPKRLAARNPSMFSAIPLLRITASSAANRRDRAGQVHIGLGDKRGPFISGRQSGKISQLILVWVLCVAHKSPFFPRVCSLASISELYHAAGVGLGNGTIHSRPGQVGPSKIRKSWRGIHTPAKASPPRNSGWSYRRVFRYNQRPRRVAYARFFCYFLAGHAADRPIALRPDAGDPASPKPNRRILAPGYPSPALQGAEPPARQIQPDDARLCDVAFVDPQHGWAVGDHGVILHTDDGGQHWSPQASGVTCTLSPSVSLMPAAAGPRAAWRIPICTTAPGSCSAPATAGCIGSVNQ